MKSDVTFKQEIVISLEYWLTTKFYNFNVSIFELPINILLQDILQKNN